MNRYQFLQEFLDALGPLSEEEKQQISDYYEELICDGLEQGLSEEEVLARFGSPQDEARRFREENPSPEPNREASLFTPSGPVHTLDLSVKEVRISLVSTEDPQLSIRFLFDPLRAHVESRQENGVWYFRHIPGKKRLREFFGLGGMRSELTVFVPEQFHGTLLLQTRNAKINGESLPALERLEAVTSNSSIRLEKLGADVCRLKTSNAPIHLAGFVGNTLEAHSSNSSLTAEFVRCASQRWETSNSSIRLTDLQAAFLTAATSNGRISANGCQAREISLASSNSSIVFERIEGEKLTICTSNGAITGTVCGDPAEYRTEGRTSNASCNLPVCSAPERSKTLSAITSNGKIQVEFV